MPDAGGWDCARAREMDGAERAALAARLGLPVEAVPARVTVLPAGERAIPLDAGEDWAARVARSREAWRRALRFQAAKALREPPAEPPRPAAPRVSPELAQLRRWVAEGLHAREIARRRGVSVRVVNKLARRHGVALPPPPPRPTPADPAVRADILALSDAGEEVAAIAARTGASRTAIAACLREEGRTGAGARPLPEGFAAAAAAHPPRALAALYAVSQTTVRRWLVRIGVEAAARFAPPDDLAERAARQTTTEIAADLGVTRRRVTDWLRRRGLKACKGRPGPAPQAAPPPGLAELAAALPVAEVAARIGLSEFTVRRWKARLGIAGPSSRACRLSAAALRRELAGGLSVAEIARRHGLGACALQRRVRRMRAQEVAHAPAPAGFLEAAAGETQDALARRFSVSRGVVRRWLAEVGAPVRPRAVVPADLAERAARQSAAEIAAELGATRRQVSTWLRARGLRARPDARRPAAGRQAAPPEGLARLAAELPAEEVAARLGLSVWVVGWWKRRLGIDGPAPARKLTREALCAALADGQPVAAIARRHGMNARGLQRRVRRLRGAGLLPEAGG